MLLRLLALLCAASVVLADYEPQPKQVSQAETEFQAALAKAEQDEAQVELALEFLDKYPDNIPLGREAQNILSRKSDKPAEWFKERMDADPTGTNRYLWARASGDPEIMHKQADWLIENDPENFWGPYLKAVAFWTEEEPALEKVTAEFEKAVALDPARFEGFIWMAYAYQEHDELDKALAAFDAAGVVDPESNNPAMGKMEIYAIMRDAERYFSLVDPMLPDEPVTVELALANGENAGKPVGFEGEYTVIESFTYW